MPDLIEALDRLVARRSGTSFWQVRYRDGRIITEGDIDWSLLPRKGLIAARLICPDGQVGRIDNIDGDERLFQLKAGRLMMGIRSEGMTARANSMRRCDAQILGVILDTVGTCKLHVWEYPIRGEYQIVHPDGVVETRAYARPGRLITFEDNVFAMRYANIGRLSADVLGIRPD
jgi:hypothetical protein